MEQTSDVMTAKEAAAFLKVSPEQVYALVNRGEIPGKKVGGSWRFLRSKLLEWLAKGD